jgi:hypothetical protein
MKIFDNELFIDKIYIINSAEHNVHRRVGEFATRVQRDGLNIEAGTIVVQLEFHGSEQQQFHCAGSLKNHRRLMI